MKDYFLIRQNLKDDYLKIYKNGCNAALLEIATINTISDEELDNFIISRGLDITKFQAENNT